MKDLFDDGNDLFTSEEDDLFPTFNPPKKTTKEKEEDHNEYKEETNKEA